MQEIKPVPAIEKAVAIFEYLQNNYEGATLSEISTHLGFAKSSTHGILSTLKQHGLLALQGNNARFVLGPKFLSFAYSAERSLDVVQVAYPFMVELRDKINETVKISIKDKDSAVVISKIEAKKDHHVSTQVGARYPLHVGAAGKVLLAYSMPAEIDHYLESVLEKYTDHTINTPEALKLELDTILSTGYAEDHGERFLDIRAIACPIFDFTQKVKAVISIPYLFIPDEDEKKRRMLDQLILYSKKASERLGYYA